MKRQNRRSVKTGQTADPAEGGTLVRPVHRLPFYVAALGASAGGLKALNAFFDAMPPASGLAFVVVQHLSPDYKSQLVELLKRRTSMPVFQVTDGMGVKANQVYVIPPNKCMVIFHGKLLLSPFTQGTGPKLPIDHFFMSLAQDQADRSIAISLSGTGSDGTRGVRAIREAGGLVIVQVERTALFEGMPHSAIATGMADCILSPAEMPAFLSRFVKHPSLRRSNGSNLPEGALEKMSALIRAQTGMDFTYYKRSTLVRRLERRMGISQTENIDQYLEFLQQTPQELTALQSDLLISVTRFFRDAEAFQLLQSTVIPSLFADAGRERSIRIWVPGCATGEEAYSVAMLLDEHAATLPVEYSIKVFATDVNAAAVHFAGTGRYPASVATDVPSNLLTRYFTPEGDGYRVSRRLREKVVFATQNLLRDPPFTRVSLICCRNLLIYVQAPCQHKVLALFHFSLKPHGYLFLGSSETVGERQNAFESVNSKARIYRKSGTAFLPPPKPVATLRPSWMVPALERINPPNGIARRDALKATIHANLLADFVPTCFAVNEQNEILYSFGQPGKFTASASGPAQLDFLKLVPRSLAAGLHATLRRAREEGGMVSYRGMKWKHPEGTRLLHLTVKPISAGVDGSTVLLVFLEETDACPATPGEAGDLTADLMNDQVAALEQDLQSTRQDLVAAMHHQQASHEELQSTNEELIAANEELQSGNEELESINEELSTLNAEYQRKNEELLVANNDLENLLRTAEIGTIFLDESLRIRKFTPVAAEELNLLAGDADRLLTDLSHPLLRELARAAQQALAEERATELIVEARGPSWYLLRVSPYSRDGISEQGVVATILNVSRLKQPSASLGNKQTEVTKNVCGVPKPHPTPHCASKRKK